MTPRETSFIYTKKISDWYFPRYRRKYECKNWLKKTIFTILVLLCFFDIAYLFKCSITPSQSTLILIIFLCKHVIKRYIRICEIHTFLTAFFDHSTQQFQPFRYSNIYSFKKQWINFGVILMNDTIVLFFVW